MDESTSDALRRSGRVRRQPSRLINFLLLIVAILVTTAIFEIALRVMDYNPLANQPPKRVVDLRMHTAHSDRVVDISLLDPEQPQSSLRTDSRSYVIPSFRYDMPDATIAFLGGSTTECNAVKESLRFPAMVSDLLQAEDMRVNTLNAAHSGNTLHDSINILLNHVVYDRPDIVVVMNVANDVGILARSSADYHVRSGRVLLFSDVIDWFKWTASKHLNLAGVARQSLIVLRGRTAKARPDELQARRNRTDPGFADTLPSHLYEQRVRAFIGVARGLGIVPVLVTEPFSGSHNELTPDWADMGAQDRFNDIVRRIGEEENVLVIDLARHVKENVPDWDQPMKVFYDGIHVTDYGSQVYATHIVERITPLVKEVVSHRQAPSLY